MQFNRIFLAISTVAASPVQAQSVPADLNQFGLICFCNSRVATPHFIIPLDDNGRVLFLARNGATREQLAQAGAPISASQIQLLKDWELLAEKDKVLKTAFPVLEP